jgi:hypothetical protein
LQRMIFRVTDPVYYITKTNDFCTIQNHTIIAPYMYEKICKKPPL